MAYYAALASVLELLEDVIHRDRYPKLLLGRQQRLNSLMEKFSYLQGLLHDYSSKGNLATDRVERRIRDAADRAQDIIESEITNQFDLEDTARDVIEKVFHRLITACQNWCCPWDAGLKEVGKEVDSIAEDVKAIVESQRYENVPINFFPADNDASEHTLPASPARNIMVGFDEYLNAVKDQLCGQSSHLQVVSIVGMAGIGKTTLARNTFDDALIVHYFDFRVWITITQAYHARKILQTIIKSIGLANNELLVEEEGVLKEGIYRYLKGRRYLVVMDDVWCEQVCDDVRFMFPDDCNGSRIVLTTRLLDLALYAGNFGFLHEIQFLNEDESWYLLRDKVFGQEDCPPELEDTGKLIASSCRGLPLALVVIAGILSNVKTPEHWSEIGRNVSSALSRSDDNFSYILSLSYNHLPHRLKPCFLYMGNFPKGHDISVSKIIMLWIAEGFLKSIDGSKSLEKIGEEYLEELVKRSLLIISKKRANGQFKLCVMHDLLRDFCRHNALYECLFHAIDRKGNFYPKGAKNIHRISLYSYSPRAFCTTKFVRSILWFGRMTTSKFESFERYRFKLLRVLDASETANYFAPYAVSQMFHLKFLGLRLDSRKSKDLPPTLSKLRNLQTLILYVPGWLSISLPSEIWKLPKLRHLVIDTMILPEIPIAHDLSLSKLEYLQMLETVKDFNFTSEAIGMIPNLRRLKLCYTRIEASGIWELYCLNNLVHLKQLEELKINFHTGVFHYVESFPSSFAFPLNLRRLTLRGCRIPWEDVTVVGCLPNLQVLRLGEHSFVGEEWKPTEGEFSKLKFLLLETLDINYWHVEATHFPRLEHLKIRDCSKLVKIPIEIGDIPTLELIEVYRSGYAGDSAKLIQEEQQCYGNDLPKVVVHDRWFW